MDTINGIPALDDSDPAELIGVYSRDLRDGLITGSGPAAAELGNLPTDSGWSTGATVRYSREGRTVDISMSIQKNGTITTAGSDVLVIPADGIPTGCRPPDTRRITGFMNIGSTVTREFPVTFNTDGSITVRVTDISGSLANNGILVAAAQWVRS